MTVHLRAVRAALSLTIASALIVLLAVAGVQSSLLAPLTAFSMSALAMLVGGGLGALLALLGIFVGRHELTIGLRRRALASLTIGLLLLGPALTVIAQSRGHPPLNDVTTDLDDPPPLAPGGLAVGSSVAYPADFVSQVRTGYPDLQGTRLPTTRVEAMDMAREAAIALGWDVHHWDASSGILEARVESLVFRFVDDVTVRIVPDGGGVLVDVRSRSRDGRSDLGVNARRIRAFQARLSEG